MRLLIAAMFMLVPAMSDGVAQEIVDQWRYTLQKPAEGWRGASFDDSDWQTGNGGFGTFGTPGARIGTPWSTPSIWLRKTFELETIPAHAALLMHHDENVDVFINGRLVVKEQGYTTDYQAFPLDEAARGILKVGENVMAVRCTQTGGGQFIDVHLIDADDIPELPPAKRNTKPFLSELITKWGQDVTADDAWSEYPRPIMQRKQWTNLNGYWDYAIEPVEQRDAIDAWDGKILVPFCLESKLGGVQRLLDATESLWYRTTFDASPEKDTRTILHFEAVDYRCEVFVGGKSVGTHQGGNTPFSFDVTEAIRSGSNELIVRVEDETEAFQLHGKQTLNARGIWYTQVSGIWQTVWMETVGNSYLSDLNITTNAQQGSITIKPEIENVSDVTSIRMRVLDGDRSVAEVSVPVGVSAPVVTANVPNAKLWSPDSPHLYQLNLALIDGDGQMLDQVDSYAGIRTVGKTQDADGHWRFTLNGKTIFHWGPLDQGWWPDGLLTPPSDEAMTFDIQWLKNAGFNMIRKHIKVEPRRYYYHCDRLGMMVWQDHVSGGEREKNHWPAWTRLNPNPVDATWPAKQHDQFMLELERMIDFLEDHPSIVCWVPFNEAWGQHLTIETGKWTVNRDPTRLVNIASGGNFWPVGDIVDQHRYPHPGFPFELNTNNRFDNYIKVIGEFGGHGYPVQGHLWDVNRRNWGYGGLPKNEAEYKERYVKSIRMLADLKQQGIAAGVYTQTTDVEGEINGLMTYDRKVIKIPAEELAKIHEVLFDDEPSK